MEPTESVTPTSYTVTPRPKMLYNNSEAYSPDQYDPYYAVYDEDGELYKDTGEGNALHFLNYYRACGQTCTMIILYLKPFI